MQLSRRRGVMLAAVVTLTALTGARTAALAAGHAPAPGWSVAPRGLMMPSGQVVDPAGSYQALDAFPTGVAVAPGGATVVTIAGGPATVDTSGAPTTEIRVTDAATGILRQEFRVPDAFQSVAFDPTGTVVWVAGGAQAALDRFAVQAGGLLAPPTTVAVPGCSFVSGFAIASAGGPVWVACVQDDRLVELDPSTDTARRTVTVPHPDQVAISAGGATVYATDWKGSDVAAVSTATGAVRLVRVGAAPEGVVALPDGRVVVADSGDATVATIWPNDGGVVLSRIGWPGPGTDSPGMLAPAPGGKLWVTLAQDNAVALIEARPGGGWAVQGMVPTAWYPVAVATDQADGAVYVVSAEGLGHSAAATNPYVSPDPAAAGVDAAYLTVGTLERVDGPNAATLAVDTARVRADDAPWRPVRGAASRVESPAGPIRHIIYITRENKLYDTELGDLHPGPGVPFAVFGKTVTPNLHALATGFVDATEFYEPAFRSTLGHMWEDAGGPSDVYVREASQGHLSTDWTDPTNYPAGGLLVQQALRAGHSVRTYNEETAQQSGLVPAADQAPTSVFPNYDLSYPDTARVQGGPEGPGWRSEFDQFVAHRCTGQLAATYGARCDLPALEYVYLGEDHTTVVDEPGYPTIEAQVADNDYATAEVIDAVSHSPYWSSTLVVVTEDDPQGTGDHESQYRGLMAVAGPWVKRGYTTDVHYQWTSVVAAIERILGLRPLSNLVAEARPLDDMFTTTPDLTPYVADPSGVATYPFTPLPPGPSPVPPP